MPIFDKEAPHYDDWYELPIGRLADEIESEHLLRLLSVIKGMRILDVGTGTGNFALQLAERGAEATAIDISDPMLAEAEKKAKEKNLSVRFKKMDAADLAFPDGTFDAAVAVTTLEFVASSEDVYAEMKRVVRPGGGIVIGAINRSSDWGRFYRSRKMQEETVFGHARFFTKEELVHLDESAVEEVGECLFVPPDANEEDITRKREAELEGKREGGFLCALYRKKEM